MAGHAAAYLLLAGLFLLRVVHPTADPPYFLDWSGGLYFDGGAYTHNARNRLLFGEWRLDQWNNMYYSPLHNLLVYATFSLFGIGLLQERLVPITLSGLSLLLFYLLLRRAFGASTAFLGTLLLGANYLFIMFGRLGLLEIPQIFAATLTLYCFGNGVAGRGLRWFFLAGAASFLVYVFKNLGAYFVGAALASAVYASVSGPKRNRWGGLAAYLGGLGASVLVWLVTFYLPNREAIAAIGSLWLAQSLPATPAQLAANVLTQPFFVAFARIPGVALLGFLGLALVGYLALRFRAGLHPVELFAGTWLASGAGFLALLSYRPVRYYVPLIPPLCLLAARLAVHALRPLDLPARARRDPLLYLTVVLSALALAYFGLLPYLRWEVTLGTRFLLSLPVAIGALALAVLLLRPWSDREVRLRAGVGWGLLALLAVAVGLDLYQYWQWERRPSYGLVRISQELGRLPGRAVIAGLSTPALVLENGHRAIYAGREGWFDATPDLFQRHPEISHLLLATYNDELNWYYRTFPEVMARARLLKIYHVWKTYLFLYALREGESPRLLFPVGDTGGYDAVVHAVSFPFTVEPGQVFQATITMRNGGRQPWRPADGVALGAREDGDPFATARHHLRPEVVIRPGETVTFSLPMRAPSRPGLYVSDWQMVKERAFWFGEPHLVVVWVKARP